MNYKSTIIQNKPDYIGRKLLLINRNRESLFKTDDNQRIEIKITPRGKLTVHKIDKRFRKEKITFSLRKIGETFLGLKDPSVPQVLNYLITPEMEIERIFNSLRYKYLKAVHLSKFPNPHKFFEAKYNKAFQSLANIPVYQGNTKERKPNDYFWKNAGFTPNIRKDINFNTEKQNLSFIIAYLKSLNIANFNKVYAELIAIKPGFHELLIHNNYFKKESIPTDKDIRSNIFRLLRGIGKISDIKLSKLPRELNSQNYLTYASCSITEGSFVFRKKLSVSYFKEIRKIKSEKDLQTIKNHFHILDYRYADLSTIGKLSNFLSRAEKFRYFI